MGARIKHLTDHWSQNPQNPRDYIDQMRELSTQVQETAQTALRNTLHALATHLRANDWDERRQHACKKDWHYFPVRPLVFGGDDVTLLCAGPWGLAVAQRYLHELETLTLPDGQGGQTPPYACAGVSIVKTHYPFSQAYSLSEDLLKEAKSRSKKLAQKQASVLDWHLTTTGLHGDLDTIRAREYTVPAGLLAMRPLVLDPGLSWRNWDSLTRLIDEFGVFGDWQERRNKTLRLREALRGGPDRVKEFWLIFGEEGQKLPTALLLDATLEYGWVKPLRDSDDRARCLYFDAIEIGEQFFELLDKQEAA